MATRLSHPVESKAIRFAPARNGEPAASFWKVWAEGSEIYALCRSLGGAPKISVHASGQIHYRLEAKLKQDLAPSMPLGTGLWHHAFELRFLLSEGALAPLGWRESLKNKSAHLIPVSDGFVLHANLIVGAPGISSDCSLPCEFLPAGQALWRARLRDGRLAVLVARMLELDDQNRDHIRFMREELQPTANLSTLPSGRERMEVFNFHWSPDGGNIVLVVPMGNEAFRSEQERSAPDQPCEPRQFSYCCPASFAEILAPDGRRAAVFSLDQGETNIDLTKGGPTIVTVGMLSVQLEPRNLVAGSAFIATPCKLVCMPSVSGGNPRTWEYMVIARFDGFAMSTELRQVSVSLQNRNLAVPVRQLDASEELVMTIPSETLKLSVTLDAPVASTAILGRFTLRNRR